MLSTALLGASSQAAVMYVRNKIITKYFDPLCLENGKVSNKELKIAKPLNDYFAFVFTVQDTYEIEEITPVQCNLTISSRCNFTEGAVTKTFDKFKLKKNCLS